jgi:hypothetical protein
MALTAGTKQGTGEKWEKKRHLWKMEKINQSVAKDENFQILKTEEIENCSAGARAKASKCESESEKNLWNKIADCLESLENSQTNENQASQECKNFQNSLGEALAMPAFREWLSNPSERSSEAIKLLNLLSAYDSGVNYNLSYRKMSSFTSKMIRRAPKPPQEMLTVENQSKWKGWGTGIQNMFRRFAGKGVELPQTAFTAMLNGRAIRCTEMNVLSQSENGALEANPSFEASLARHQQAKTKHLYFNCEYTDPT